MRQSMRRWPLAGLIIAAGCLPSTPIEQEGDPAECTGFNACLLDEDPRAPFQIRYSLRLQDVSGQAIKDGVTRDSFRIFEDEEPLDLAETSQFLTEGDNLPLKIVLLLDYTQSMVAADALQSMIDAARFFIDPTPLRPRQDLFGLMTYHSTQSRLLVVDERQPDPADDFCGYCSGFQGLGASFSVLLDPQRLKCSFERCGVPVDELAADEDERLMHSPDEVREAFNCIERLQSDDEDALPWPALDHAITLLNDPAGSPGGYRAIVFVGEGCSEVDCGAEITPLVQRATQRTPTTHVYVIAPEGARNPNALARLAADTGGRFLRIGDIIDDDPLDWRGAFSRVALDLQRQHLPLKVMVVLDSSATAIRSGTRRAALDAASEFVAPSLYNATHRIGVVEFHDRTPVDQGYGTVIGLTQTDCVGKRELVDSIPEVGELESGQTRLWDAMTVALSMLTADEAPGERRLVVFLTDGNDTSSQRSIDDIMKASLVEGQPNISFYPIGFGDVTPENEKKLRRMADVTNGAYATAATAADLQPAFRAIAEDLRGQWELTYMTQKVAGLVRVRVEFTYDEQTTFFEQAFDASALRGKDIHTGLLVVEEPRYDDEADQTRFNIRADYIPRNINRFRFKLPFGARFDLLDSGGLISHKAGWRTVSVGRASDLQGVTVPNVAAREDWTLVYWAPSMFEQRRTNLDGAMISPLPFGAFGTLGVITVPGKHNALILEHDDAIYDTLPQSKSMSIEPWRGDVTLTIVEAPGGTVIVEPDATTFRVGDAVRLEAIPQAGYVFVGWEIDGQSVSEAAVLNFTVDQARTLTPVFEPVTPSSSQNAPDVDARPRPGRQPTPAPRRHTVPPISGSR